MMYTSVHMLRIILLGAGVLSALFAILIFSGKIPVGGKSTTAPQGEVIIWGTIPQENIATTLQAFNAQTKTYRVIYQYLKEDSFAQDLVEALASNRGPDMILAPQQIILSQQARIYPFPATSFPEKSFKDMYVDGASLFFSPQGALAFPVSIEPMVLFYNRTLFSKNGIVNPPVYWDEVSAIIPALTIRGDRGQFLESGINLGSATTAYAKDIMMTIVSQLGQTPVLAQYGSDGTVRASVLANNPVTSDGEIYPLATVVRFFTQFGDPTKETYTWNQYVGNADDQFVAGKLAMYIGYSGEYDTLRARNPRGEFSMAILPQTRGYNTFVTGARMYGIATLSAGKNIAGALAVQTAFAGNVISPQIAASIGAAPALRSYVQSVGIDPVLSKSMLVAKGWYDPLFIQSTNYTTTMVSDILNNRYGPNDAAMLFVSRLQELYSK